MTDIVTKVIGYLVPPIERQLRYLFCYLTYTVDLDNKLKELKRVRDDLQITVGYETKRAGYEIRPIVQEWLDGVDVIIREAEELMNDENNGCFNGWCPNFKSRYLLGKKADEKAQEIVQKIKKKKFPDGVVYGVPLRNSTLKDLETFESRTLILNQIVDALKDHKIKMVGVWGMGGVGKTTLVKQVAEQAMQGNLFTTEVYIDVSWTRDSEKPQRGISKIQQKIAEMLHLELRGKVESTRAVELNYRLKNEKILIILDDIWKEIDLEEVGIPCKDDATACKVVLTSRQRGMLFRDMGTCKDFHVNHLCDEEAWKLFQRIAGDFEQEHDLRPIATEVLKKCEGLPVAIVTIAKALKGDKVADWRNALQELRMSTPTNINGVTENVYSCLEWSYKHLKSAEAKSLFLLIGSLGDGDVSLQDLLNYGMGLDLFDNIDSLEQARDRVVVLVKILKDSSLLLDPFEDGHYSFEDDRSLFFAEEDNGFVRMHDVVRDVCKAIGSKDHGFVVKEAVGLQGWQQRVHELGNCTRISLNCRAISWNYENIRVLPGGLVCPKLQFFLVNGHWEYLIIPDAFFKEMKELRVLGLNIFAPIKFSLLHPLSNLRTLCLHKCDIMEGIKMLGELKKLHILSLVDFDFLVLPKEMSQLTDLRMLNLRGRHFLDPENVMSSLSQLEHLCIRAEYRQAFQASQGGIAREVHDFRYELKHLFCLRALEFKIPVSSLLLDDVSVKNLTRYDISIGSISHWDGGYHRIRTSSRLILNVVDAQHLVRCFSRLLKTVEVLNLMGLNDAKHFFNELDCDGFPKLKYLSISLSRAMQDIINTMDKEWVDPPHSAFPCLEELRLRDLEQLQAVWRGPIWISCFTNLRALIIEKCKSLKYIIWLPTTQARESVLEFPQLGSLKLELPNLINFYSTGTSGSQEPCSSFFNQVALPRLESLHLKLSLDNVRTMWDSQDPVGCFQNLNSLRIRGFTSLKYLFPASVVKGLKQLKDLSIRSCGVEEIVANENGVEAVPMFEFPSLTSLKLRGLGQLKRFYREKYTLSCPLLKKLCVRRCDKVELLFQEKCLEGELDEQPLFLIEKSTFPNVEELVLSFTGPMEIWRGQFSRESFGKLRVLTIRMCEGIPVAIPCSKIPVLRNLEELNVEDCNTVEEVIQEEGLAGETIPRLTEICLERLPSLMHLSGLQPILQNLHSLLVVDCGNLMNLVSPSMAKRLVQLKELWITDCSMVKEIVGADVSEATDDISFPNLKKLGLQNLVVLESFSSASNTFKFPSLTHIRITDCPQMEYFCMGHSMTPRLEELYMDGVSLDLENDLNTIIRNYFTEWNAELMEEDFEEYGDFKELDPKEEDSEDEVPDEEDDEDGDSEEQHPNVEDSVEEDTEEEDSEGRSGSLGPRS